MPGYARLGQLSTGVLAGTGEPANRRLTCFTPELFPYCRHKNNNHRTNMIIIIEHQNRTIRIAN